MPGVGSPGSHSGRVQHHQRASHCRSLAQEEMDIQNTEYILHWLCIAFAPSSSRKIGSQTIISWGPSVHKSQKHNGTREKQKIVYSAAIFKESDKWVKLNNVLSRNTWYMVKKTTTKNNPPFWKQKNENNNSADPWWIWASQGCVPGWALKLPGWFDHHVS